MFKIKKQFFILLGVIVTLIIGFYLVTSYNKKPEKKQTKINNIQKEVPNKTIPSSVLIDDIPVEREDINSQLTLEQRKAGLKLSPPEEKIIIESLASQVSIDTKKSYFDYKGGFGMVPAIREIFADMDDAFYLFTDKGKFFVKINPFSDLSRFEYEKESMLAINETVPDLSPYPLCLGNLPKGGKFLVVNFIEARWEDRLIVKNQKSLAKNLTQLHQKKSPNGKFGFHSGKNNQGKDSGATFFYENRGQPLYKRICEKYPYDNEFEKGGNIISEKVIPDLLGNLPIEPVLIHGTLDFDSGDIDSRTNQPGVFDPHSYYGHNEMDLSLIHYSDKELDGPGGKVPEICKGEFFESEFWAEYQKYYPLPPGFEERKTLYKLYHRLYRNVLTMDDPRSKISKKALTIMQKLGQKYN